MSHWQGVHWHLSRTVTVTVTHASGGRQLDRMQLSTDAFTLSLAILANYKNQISVVICADKVAAQGQITVQGGSSGRAPGLG